MRILVAYREIPEAPGWATGASMVRAFRRMGHETYAYAKVYRSNEWLWPFGVADNRTPSGFRGIGPFDLLLRMECGDEEAQYPELAELPKECRKVYWTFDVARYPEREVAIAAELAPDLVLCGNPRYRGFFSPVRTAVGGIPHVEYLPYAVDPDLFHPGTVERMGCAMIGSPFPEREEFAKAAGVQLHHGLRHDAYAALLRRLKIHVHHHASGGQGLLVMRPFETMGSGTLLLTEEDETHALHPDIPWVTYRDADDCRSLVQHFLEWPVPLRQKSAEQHAAVMAAHTYRHRAEAILEMIG